MRGWIMWVGAAAALAACGDGNQADDGQDLNQALTARNIVANDVTAIDAVTGDAANMAEDVDFTDELANELGPAEGNASDARPRRSGTADRSAPSPRPRPAPRADPPAPATAPATEPAGNSTE